MLHSTYIHCPGIGEKTERKLWSLGAKTWSEYAEMESNLRISKQQRTRLTPVVSESLQRLAEGDFAWFAERIPPKEHWRAFPFFRDRIAYVDIETNGGMTPFDLTVVGVYDGSDMHQCVRGSNLNDFPDLIRDKALIVTFFGTGFDLPFLRRAYRMEFPQLHIDLCFLLKRLGYSGGLKQVEREFGIYRSDETDGLSGMDAVRMWRAWRAGNRWALNTLLAYNREDVLNMETLMETAYELMLEKTLMNEAEAV